MYHDVHEKRFDMTREALMTPECSKYREVGVNYKWARESLKETLKDLKKDCYYQLGEYGNVNTKMLDERRETFIDFKAKPGRDDYTLSGGHYIRDQKGFRFSAHLSGPDAKMAKKFEKLGHVKEHKIMGFGQQAPRDNKMYYIGEGGNNLKKMDSHVRRTSGSIGLFQS